MWPELGRYAFAVLSSYAVTFALLGGLIAMTLHRAARVKRTLAEVEANRRRGREA
jgi:heme exporter protein D